MRRYVFDIVNLNNEKIIFIYLIDWKWIFTWRKRR